MSLITETIPTKITTKMTDKEDILTRIMELLEEIRDQGRERKCCCCKEDRCCKETAPKRAKTSQEKNREAYLAASAKGEAFDFDDE